MKSGFVSIIGRPNVGKSTLLNQILGQKIVITTDKPQTTRKRIKGIFTTTKGQIVFVDTPGIHKPLNKLGEFLLDEAKISIPDSDLILFLVDGSDSAGKGDKWICKNLLQTEIPIIIVMNKVDKIKDINKVQDNLLSYQAMFNKSLPFIKISAKTGLNIDILIDNIYDNLPNGDLLYPEDVVTEETMRDVTEEIIREKILLNTSDEIPHSVAVKITSYSEGKDIDKIYADIFCETKSQKGILIGKNGNMLKTIGTQTRQELENIAKKKVFLSLNVKVSKNWRKNNNSLKNFGYKQIN